jgi:aminopeptidase N
MSIAEITRSQTEERGRLLRVESYDVTLDLCRGAAVFGSTSVIRFSCREPGATSYVDLIAADVSEVTLNGRPIDPGRAYREGRITLDGLASDNELRVVAECAYSSDGTGLHRAVDSADGKTYLYTKFEPADARRVYANFEQPDLKAAFTFHVIAAAHWTVLSNQPAPEPIPDDTAAPGAAGPGQARAIWHFPPTPRISTYITVVVAGEYHLVRDTHTTPGGQVIPLGLACRASLAEHLDADELLVVTRQGLDYFTGRFGMDFPFVKYDQVFVPEFSAGAMENAGCVVISEQLLFRSKVTDTMYELRADVILHEMAHMWFGDLVTMRWWDDLWLNESFAEYCGTAASAEATRFTRAWTTFASGRKNWAYQQDQLPSTHPIASHVQTVTEAIANFDGISYAKGASVLKQLAAYVGTENFFAGVNAYLTEHAWDNATLADLLRALEHASGRNLGDWSTSWLESAGANTLRPDIAVGPDGTFTSFAVLQEATQQHPTLRPQRIAIGLYNRDSGKLARTHRVEIDVSGERTAVPELTGLPRPDLVLLNDDDLGYALIRFDDASLRTLTSSIGEFTDSLARSVCLGSALDMAQRAELSLPALVRTVRAGMGSESSVSVLQMTLNMVRLMIMMAGDPAWVPTGESQLASAAARLLREAEPGSDLQLAWAQLIAWTATTDEQLGLVGGLLDGSVVIGGLAVDTELRWALLRRLAVAGRAGDSDIDAELVRDASDAGRRHATACRASIPDARHKADAWRLLTEDTELGLDTMIEVATFFNVPEHAAVLAPFAERYFEVLPGLWSSRGERFRLVLGEMLFPYPAASPELLRRIDAFLATDRDPGMVRLISERSDIVERALRSRNLPD